MTWSDPEAGKAFFQTNDVPTEANFSTYILDNLLSLMHPIDTTTADNDVNTTTTETTLYSVTIPANALGASGAVWMRLEGDYLFNNAADTFRIREKFGGVTIIDSGAVVLSTNNAGRFPWVLDLFLRADGATNAQVVTSVFTYYRVGSSTAAAVGIGAFMSGKPDGGLIQNTSTIDTTSNQALVVTVQWSASSANNSWRRRWAQTLVGRN